jgi:F-type H+-transporting ATPase subunit b
VNLRELLFSACAWASSAEAEHHSPSIHDIWFPLVNFLIFAYIIKRFALPLVRDFLKSRRAEVLTAVKEAAERKQRAQAMVQEYKERLAGLAQETQSIEALWRADAEREKARLLKEAEAMATKIQQDARFLADQEVKVARQKIRQEIANQAEATARSLIERHISVADHERLARESIDSIGEVR